MSSLWTCKFLDAASTDPVETEEMTRSITVGDVLRLRCKGDAISFNKDALKISLAGAQENRAMVLIRTHTLGEDGGEFDVTSYVVGEHKSETFVLSDGERFTELSPLKFTVSTVIEDQNQEPYPAFGPWALSWPFWYWLVLAAFLGAMGFLSVWLFRRWKREFDLKKEIEDYRAKHSPFDEFQKEVRHIKKKVVGPTVSPDTVSELERQFRLYLTREFIIRFLEIGDRRSLRHLKKRFPKSFGSLEKDLKTAFNEFSRAGKREVKLEDFDQILKLTSKISDRVFDLREREAGSNDLG